MPLNENDKRVIRDIVRQELRAVLTARPADGALTPIEALKRLAKH